MRDEEFHEEAASPIMEPRTRAPFWGSDPISEATEQKYADCYRTLCKRALEAIEIPPGARLDRVDFVEWLIGTYAPTVKKPTWRFSKAAVSHGLGAENAEDSQEALSILLRHGPADGFQTRSSKRSRRKSLPRHEFDMIVKALLASPSDYGELTATWLEISRVLGIRPVETATTKIEHDEDGPIVVVLNAKSTQGRGLGKERRLSLSIFSAADRERYLSFFKTLRDIHASGKYQTCYDNCRKQLNLTCLRLWPRRQSTYSLYSGRHQFSANAKGRLDLLSVAALMGHASDATAVRHYGNRRKSDGSQVPKVDSAARALVRSVYQTTRTSPGDTAPATLETTPSEASNMKYSPVRGTAG